MSEMWRAIPDKTTDIWLEVVDPDGWYSAIVKWDGCVDFYSYANSPFVEGENRDEDCDDYIHICDLDEYIDRLTKLRDEARKHFSNHWYGHWKTP